MKCPDDVVLVMPTKRLPPIKTFESYGIPDMKILIIADPDVYRLHLSSFTRNSQVEVILGGRGIGIQNWNCYLYAAVYDFPWFFKVDDDLFPDTFVEIDGSHPTLEEVIHYARCCVDLTKTTFAGFSNTSRRDWLSDEYKRTYGLIHGGANIAASVLDPSPFIDRKIVRSGDVYRSLAHRKIDGAVGRVGFIGFDKSKSTRDTSVIVTQEELDTEREMILKRFPGMVTCKGTRMIQNDTMEITNWRLQRGHYIKEVPDGVGNE